MRFANYLNRFGKHLRRAPRSKRPEMFTGRPRPGMAVRPGVEQLEDRCLLNVDYGLLHTQVPMLLAPMQAAVTQKILADPMPLVGSGLQYNAPAAFLNPIATNLGKALPSSGKTTPQQVQDALYNTLNGMNLFPAGSTEGQDVQVSPSGDGSEFKVHIDNTQNPLVLSQPFDLGLPNLHLHASGNVQVTLSYKLELYFIVATQGGTTHVWLDTAPTEITLAADIKIPNSLAGASFGPLGLNLYDGGFPQGKVWTTPRMSPSEFKGTFTFDVTGPNVDASGATASYFLSHSTVTLLGNADVNLAAELTVQDFPAMALNFQVHWPFTQGNLDGDVPTVSFNDVQLDVGSLLTRVLQPYASSLNKTLAPVNAVVQMLTEPLPVVSDLSHMTGGGDVSLFDIARAIDPGLSALQPFVTAFNALYALDTNLIKLPQEDAVIDYGSFNLGNADPRSSSFDPTQVTPNITRTQPSAQQQLQGNPGVQDVYKFIYDPKTGLEGSDLGQLQLPFLDSPMAVFQTMLGQQVTLLQYSTPVMDSGSGDNSELRINEDFGGVLGPFGVRIDGNMHLHADLTVGFDTYGLIHGNPLDGVFVSQADAYLLGQFKAAFDFDPSLVFDPYIQGVVNSTINLSLASGPVRYTDLIAAENNPLALFNKPAGKIDGSLDVGIRVGVQLPIVGFVGADYSVQLVDKVLLDLDALSGSSLTLGTVDPSTHVLTLDLGQSVSGQPEVFEVGHHPGSSTKGHEDVDVTAYGVTQTFFDVSSITAGPTTKDETVLFDPNLLDDATLNFGDANNIVTYLGQGNATITAGNGNNAFTGGAGTNVFTLTGNGNNTLLGGSGTNTLTVTGDGNNKLTAGGGNDQLKVQGNGINFFTAGKGQDTITIVSGSTDPSAWNTISWRVGDGNLTIQARGGQNELDVAGSNQPDVFTVNPYPVLPVAGPGVQVVADGATINASSFVQKVGIEGTGGDTTTVNNLGVDTMVREIGVNLGQALAADNGKDVTTVNGDPHSHVDTVGTVSAWRHWSDLNGVRVLPQDGGVMRVQTRTAYTVDVGVVNNKDDLIVNARGSQNTINVQSSTGHTVVNTDGGSDHFVIGSDGAPNNGHLYYVPPPPASPQLLFGLRGLLDLNAGPGANALTFTDSQDAGPSNLTLTDSTLTGSAGDPSQPVNVNYNVSPSGNWTGGITLKTGKGKDTLFLRATPANAPVGLVTGGGGDQVFVGNLASTLGTIRGPVSIDGTDGTPTVTINDQNAPAGKNYLFTSILGSYYLISSNTVPPANSNTFEYQNIGKLVLNAGDHGNQVTVRSTGAAVEVHAGNGSNTVLVGDAANGNRIGAVGPLLVDGQNGSNKLFINDQGTNNPLLSYALDAQSVQRTAAGPISYSHVQDLTLNGGSGNGNTLTLLGTASGTTYAVNAGLGNNAGITLGNAGTALDGFLGDLAIDGQSGFKSLDYIDTAAKAPLNYTLAVGEFDRGPRTVARYQHIGSVALNAGSGGNEIDVPGTAAGTTTWVLPGSNKDTVRVGSGGINSTIDALLGPLNVIAKPGTGTTLEIDDQGHAPDPGRAYQITGSQVQRSGPPNPVAPITYVGLGTLQLNGSGGVYRLSSTALGTTTAVAATGAGSHNIQVGDGATLSGIQGPVQVAGQGGNNQLTLTDSLYPIGRTFVVGAGTVSAPSAPPVAPVTYSQVQQVAIQGGKGGNTFQVQSTAPGTPVLLGGGGTDTLVGPPASDNVWDITGPGAGTLTGPLLPSPVSFGGMQNLTGGAGADTFRLHTGGSVSGHIDGRGGSNTLDYSAYAGDVVADLLLKLATAVGQVLNVENVTGSAGNDILVGGGQPGTLRGGTGRNLIIAGAGASQLYGGGGDSILIAGTTRYDTNLVALDHIMLEWDRNIPAGDRVHHLTSGGGLNGPYLLIPLRAPWFGTVKSNLLVNDLYDGGGTDWLFLRTAVDNHHNAQATDVITPL